MSKRGDKIRKKFQDEAKALVMKRTQVFIPGAVKKYRRLSREAQAQFQRDKPEYFKASIQPYLASASLFDTTKRKSNKKTKPPSTWCKSGKQGAANPFPRTKDLDCAVYYPNRTVSKE